MTSTAAVYGRVYAPSALRFPERTVNWSSLAFMGAATIVTISLMSATLTSVGVIGGMMSVVHTSSYDAGLTPRPLRSTLPPPSKPSKFERVSTMADATTGQSGLSADAVRLSYEKVMTAALAANMQQTLIEFQEAARVSLAPITARIVAVAADLPRTSTGVVDFALLGHNLDVAIRHDALADEAAVIAPKPIARPQPPVVAAVEKPIPSRPAEPAPSAPERRQPKPAVVEAAPKVALAPPVVRQEPAPVVLPSSRAGVAIYDLSAGMVYLPSGERLEAHSGIGPMRDNIRFVHVKMRGPTPPATYNLTMRESLFHGVEAIRLNPVGSSAPYGRTGILAHTYMLRVPGDSNGCVVFKDYRRFLAAFKRGEIRQMVVVPNLKTRVASIF